MFHRILPARFDNDYAGGKFELWLFGTIALVKLLQSLNVIFNTAYIAAQADGIPLDTFATPARETAIALFALLGFAQGILWLLCFLALARYRSMVPLLYVVMIFHFAVSRLVLYFHPLIRTGPHGGVYVNIVLFVLMLLGFALSMRSGEAVSSTAA